MYEHDFDSFTLQPSDLSASNEQDLMHEHLHISESEARERLESNERDLMYEHDLFEKELREMELMSEHDFDSFTFKKFSVVLPDFTKFLSQTSIKQVLRRMYVKKSTGSSIQPDLEISRAEAQTVLDDFQKSSRLEMNEKKKLHFTT
ncbi:hypothetical protein GEMRC1_013691 [Eukaryota sp. GEM-RC1]